MRTVACSSLAFLLLAAGLSPRDFGGGATFVPNPERMAIAPIFVDFGISLDRRLIWADAP